MKLVHNKLQQLQSEQAQQNKQDELARWAQNFTTISVDLNGEKNSTNIKQQQTVSPQPRQSKEIEDMDGQELANEEKDLTDRISRLVRRRAIVRQFRSPNFIQTIEDSFSIVKETTTPAPELPGWSDPIL